MNFSEECGSILDGSAERFVTAVNGFFARGEGGGAAFLKVLTMASFFRVTGVGDEGADDENVAAL